MALRLNLTKGKRTRIKKNRGGQRLKKWREQQQKEEQSKQQSAAQADKTRRIQPFLKVGKRQQERRRKSVEESYSSRWGMTNEEASEDITDMYGRRDMNGELDAHAMLKMKVTTGLSNRQYESVRKELKNQLDISLPNNNDLLEEAKRFMSSYEVCTDNR